MPRKLSGWQNKQAAKRKDLTENEDTVLVKDRSTPPKTSWWANCPTREAFMDARRDREKLAGWSRGGRNQGA